MEKNQLTVRTKQVSRQTLGFCTVVRNGKARSERAAGTKADAFKGKTVLWFNPRLCRITSLQEEKFFSPPWKRE